MLLSRNHQRSFLDAIPGAQYVGPMIRVGDFEVLAIREGDKPCVGVVLQIVDGHKPGALRHTPRTEELRRQISDILGVPFTPLPITLVDDEEYDAAMARGDTGRFLGWISNHKVVELKEKLPDLDIRRCNCCDAVLIDDNVCAVEIHKTRCGKLYISDWSYIREGYPTPSDPELAAKHDARGQLLAARVAVATGIPLASKFGCAK